MRRSRVFKIIAAWALVPASALAQPWLTQEGDLWVRTFRDTAPARARLRIVAHGPVTLEGGVSANFQYVVKVSVRARSRAEAHAILEKAEPRIERQNDWLVLTVPGRAAMTTVNMRAPRLVEAVISNSEGAVETYGIDGSLTVDTGADEVKVDRIHGDCTLSTGGGAIHVGSVDGALHGNTGAGNIDVRMVEGEVVLTTNGGDISVGSAKGNAHVRTGGGSVNLGVVGGSVTAINGGGPIIVNQAGGTVTMQNMAGPVRVGAATGIHCDSNGGVILGKITGPMHVSTSMGSIVANLSGSRLAESYLATGNGDITVVIPSNVGVRISAENQMADSLRRILSEFANVQPRVRGMRVEAQGSINGGGPLLQLSAASGTIFLKRQ